MTTTHPMIVQYVLRGVSMTGSYPRWGRGGECEKSSLYDLKKLGGVQRFAFRFGVSRRSA